MWLQTLWAHDFVRNAFVAGTGIALASGLVGYFLVLRSQIFSGDALGHVAFAGALVALVLGVDARWGLFTLTILAAIGIGLMGRKGRADDVAIGGFFAWVLGLGALFLTLYTTSKSAGDGTRGVNTLFGSIFGLSGGQALAALIVGIGVSAVMVWLARPLLFASIDEAVAVARGVNVWGLGLVFLALAGVTTAEATQAVGALLVLGLLAAPAGAAQRLTNRPFQAMGLSAGLALAAMWLGLLVSYAVPWVPPSFAILALVSGFYVIAAVGSRWVRA